MKEIGFPMLQPPVGVKRCSKRGHRHCFSMDAFAKSSLGNACDNLNEGSRSIVLMIMNFLRGHFIRRKYSISFACALFSASLMAAEIDVRRDATVEAIARVMPSVVNIGTENVVEYRDDPFENLFREFFDPYHRRRERSNPFSLGSGVIIDEDGYILTNLHVVQRARRIQVKLSDEAGGGEYEVEPILGTPLTDVALLKIIPKKPGEKFTAVKFASDDDLLLGETVIALGNPFGLGGSVSRGILSAKRRAAPKDGEPLAVPNWLQTDASINPGNSGGPLINLRGELIGLNVAIAAQGQGIGFAIPIKQLREAVADIFTPERSGNNPRWFGAKISLSSTPLIVQAIDKNSPADQAGLQVGDRVLQVNGKTPKSFIEFNQWLRDDSVKDFSFAIQRGAQRSTAAVRLISFQQLLRQKLGFDAQELEADLAQNLGLRTRSGLLIAGVEKNGPAEQARVARGFVVTEINGKSSPDFVNAMTTLFNLKKGDAARLTLLVPQRRGNFFGYQQGAATLNVR